MADPDPPCGSAELFILGCDGLEHKIRDPVCGRLVDRRGAIARRSKGGPPCYFCSRRCLLLYYLDFRRYLTRPPPRP